MTNNKSKTIILASVIGTLLDTYEANERTKLHEEIRGRIGRGMRSLSKGVDGMEALIKCIKDGHAVWENTIHYFAERNVTIEASALILSLWNMDDKQLGKLFNLNKGIVGKWAKPTRREDARELETTSREVGKYINTQINELYGIVVPEKKSILERLGKK